MYHWLGKWMTKHEHEFELATDMISEIWLECSCGEQRDIPPERLEEAYEKLRRRDHSWSEK